MKPLEGESGQLCFSIVWRANSSSKSSNSESLWACEDVGMVFCERSQSPPPRHPMTRTNRAIIASETTLVRFTHIFPLSAAVHWRPVCRYVGAKMRVGTHQSPACVPAPHREAIITHLHRWACLQRNTLVCALRLHKEHLVDVMLLLLKSKTSRQKQSVNHCYKERASIILRLKTIKILSAS